MANMERVISYTFQLKDNVTATAGNMKGAAEGSDKAVKTLIADETTLEATTQRTKATLDSTQVSLITQMASIASLRAGIGGLTSGMKNLGLVTDQTAQTLDELNAGFALFSGAVQLVKGLQAVMATLNITTATYASIMTYLSVLKNPLYAALAGAGVGAAAGVGAYLLMNNNTSNNNTQINITDTAGAQNTASEISYIQGALK